MVTALDLGLNWDDPMIQCCTFCMHTRGVEFNMAAETGVDKLIALYEQEECLWVTKSKNYHHKGKKAHALKQIAAGMGWNGKQL